MKTAKALGLKGPLSLQASADEVIDLKTGDFRCWPGAAFVVRTDLVAIGGKADATGSRANERLTLNGHSGHCCAALHLGCPMMCYNRFFEGKKRAMRRREFTTLVGGVTLFGTIAVWPLTAWAQDRIRRVGAGPVPATDPVFRQAIEAFTAAMKDAGWVDGGNLRSKSFPFSAVGKPRTTLRRTPLPCRRTCSSQ